MKIWQNVQLAPGDAIMSTLSDFLIFDGDVLMIEYIGDLGQETAGLVLVIGTTSYLLRSGLQKYSLPSQRSVFTVTNNSAQTRNINIYMRKS
jgi:hypothetical protein